ncbi:MAG: hypothetical protein AB7U20_08435, partial [Planctomycetaceae bacterium]
MTACHPAAALKRSERVDVQCRPPPALALADKPASGTLIQRQTDKLTRHPNSGTRRPSHPGALP